MDGLQEKARMDMLRRRMPEFQVVIDILKILLLREGGRATDAADDVSILLLREQLERLP